MRSQPKSRQETPRETQPEGGGRARGNQMTGMFLAGAHNNATTYERLLMLLSLDYGGTQATGQSGKSIYSHIQNHLFRSAQRGGHRVRRPHAGAARRRLDTTTKQSFRKVILSRQAGQQPTRACRTQVTACGHTLRYVAELHHRNEKKRKGSARRCRPQAT